MLPRPPDGLGPTLQPSLTPVLATGGQQQSQQQPRIVHRIVGHTDKVGVFCVHMTAWTTTEDPLTAPEQNKTNR